MLFGKKKEVSGKRLSDALSQAEIRKVEEYLDGISRKNPAMSGSWFIVSTKVSGDSPLESDEIDFLARLCESWYDVRKEEDARRIGQKIRTLQ